MGSRRIRVSSRALGDLRHCIVHVYDTADEMCAAGASLGGRGRAGQRVRSLYRFGYYE